MNTETGRSTNPVRALAGFGQSVWLDYIRRRMLTGGELERLIREDGISGVTSNPAIFRKAIAGSHDYDDLFAALAGDTALSAVEIYERIALDDIRQAADLLRPVFDQTGGRDGYVSLEVSPRLANDTEGTCREARRLWAALDRPNVMIKVPATEAGLPAIETLLAEGINVNVTLLFSVAMYERVVEAYLRALERRLSEGGAAGGVASVASFFVSRIDTAVDKHIESRLAEPGLPPEDRAELEGLRGRVAIANARAAYARFRELFAGPRWEALAARGARVQRLLWASTSVKNPAYRDVRYVEELIGPDTVNTVPPATLDAFRDHGRPRAALLEDADAGQEVLATADRLRIPLEAITAQLLEAGVRKFIDAFDGLLEVVETARCKVACALNTMALSLPEDLAAAVESAIRDWQDNDKVRRLWARDAWLWTGRDEARWMDWLEITCSQLQHLGDLRQIGHTVEGRHFRHVVLIGMGGSSMAPEVMARTFGAQPGFPELLVLDSTDPGQIRDIESRIDCERTLFLVASKSGSTLEPNILMDHFFTRAEAELGREDAGRHFIAITDPGSSLERKAGELGFRRVFHGVPGIGGRYSALSNFGVVPAAAMGVDVERLLERAEVMVEACAACVPASENPGVLLGLVMGVAARQGRDKLTLLATPGIAGLGAWLEQLVAESTGKQGKAIIPVDGEPPGAPEQYGDDRLFVYVRIQGEQAPQMEQAVAALEGAGHPVVRITVQDAYGLGQEFFRWEIATAVAGSILEINPFDQPDVEASKIATRELTEAFEASGRLPEADPVAEAQGIRLYADAAYAGKLAAQAGADAGLGELLAAHLACIESGDYFALLAYINRNADHEALLQRLRLRVRDARRVATCVGFGPRFLHSTGQAYKGGPNTGVFVQITCEEADDLPVPGRRYSFGVVKRAQALGDFQVLAERGRRLVRLHIGPDTAAGLRQLDGWFADILGGQ